MRPAQAVPGCSRTARAHCRPRRPAASGPAGRSTVARPAGGQELLISRRLLLQLVLGDHGRWPTASRGRRHARSSERRWFASSSAQLHPPEHRGSDPAGTAASAAALISAAVQRRFAGRRRCLPSCSSRLGAAVAARARHSDLATSKPDHRSVEGSRAGRARAAGARKQARAGALEQDRETQLERDCGVLRSLISWRALI